MSSMAVITFSFGVKDVSIQCPKNKKMKDICQVFAKQIEHDINSLSFLYGGNQINLESNFEDLALPNDKANNKIKIIVVKNEKEENYCPFCSVKTLLKNEEVEIITLSNNSIRKGIDDVQKYIEKLINNCYIRSISIQLQNVNLLLSSISKQVEDCNKNLQKPLINMTNSDNIKIYENKVNIKNDKVEKENNDKKEKELNEKQQKELEMKKKLEEEEKKKNEVNQKLLKEKEDKKRKEQLKIQKKQFENDKLKQETFIMSTPDLRFACTCTNLMILQQYIYEGTDCAEIPLMLKNEGSFVWPKNFTKLVFEKKYNIKGKNVELNGLEPGQEEQYIAKIEGLGNLPVGEYETGVYFNIKGSNCGNMMKIKIFIIKKDVDPKIKYKNEIKRFRDEYDLKKEEYSDDEIYDILESNDFDLEKAFKCLAGEI